MRDLPRIARVRLELAPRADAEAGLIGFVRVAYGDLELDGITLRRITRGEPAVSWPSRRHRRGRSHALARPRSRDVRLELDRQILGALGLGEGGAA